MYNNLCLKNDVRVYFSFGTKASVTGMLTCEAFNLLQEETTFHRLGKCLEPFVTSLALRKERREDAHDRLRSESAEAPWAEELPGVDFEGSFLIQIWSIFSSFICIVLFYPKCPVHCWNAHLVNLRASAREKWLLVYWNFILNASIVNCSRETLYLASHTGFCERIQSQWTHWWSQKETLSSEKDRLNLYVTCCILSCINVNCHNACHGKEAKATRFMAAPWTHEYIMCIVLMTQTSFVFNN